jgi:hypothetical protein
MEPPIITPAVGGIIKQLDTIVIDLRATWERVFTPTTTLGYFEVGEGGTGVLLLDR